MRSDVSGTIGLNELTLDFLMSERQRELASELVRRTEIGRASCRERVFVHV